MKNIIVKTFLLLLIFSFVGCASCGRSHSKIRKPKESKDFLKQACDNLRKLSCKEGTNLVYPTKCSLDKDCLDGRCLLNKCTETCEEVFGALISSGKYIGLKCISNIKSCNEVEKKCRKM